MREVRGWAWGILQVVFLLAVLGFVIFAVMQFAGFRAHSWNQRHHWAG